MTKNLPRIASRLVESQAWLDGLGDLLKLSIQRAYQLGGPTGQAVKNFLHGVWLGHPLHPVLTDVPLGAFTTALVFDSLADVTGKTSYLRGAQAAVGLGVTGAVGAAVAGLTDYQHMKKGVPRRVGLVHGVLNLAATGLYAASWLARRRGRHTAGMQLGLAGYGALLAGAYLGGHMVYDHQVGVKQTAEAKPPKDFTATLPIGELREGQLKRVEVNGYPVLLVRRHEQIYAMAEVCTHLRGPLSEGWLVEDTVVCPWHQSRYRLSDGQPVDGPTTYSQACFETRVQDGLIEVRLARTAAPEPARVPRPATPKPVEPAPARARA